MDQQSSKVCHSGKPKFPLWHHKASGRWCKKAGNKFHYFERLSDDPTGEKSLSEWMEMKSGRSSKPANNGKALTVRNLVNKWLGHKEERVKSGELTAGTFKDYHASAAFLLSTLGLHTLVKDLGPADFQALRGRLAKTNGPLRLKGQMNVIASIFKFGEESGLWEGKVRFGPAWEVPSRNTLRKHRAKQGVRMFSPAEIRKLLEHADTNLKCMILIAANGGVGNTDLALMPTAALDLNGGWLDLPRHKTGIMRRIPLWPESIESIRQVLAERKQPKDPANNSLLFISPYRVTYASTPSKITKLMTRLTKAAGVEGRTFYDLRRTFQTVGEEAGDLVATQSLMGHAAASSDMSAVYRQRVSDERLRAVTAHVRNWLFGENE